jgi:hypothetical protein
MTSTEVGMAGPRARIFDGMKFMWDGREYDSTEEAQKVRAEYEKERFEVHVVEEDGKIHVYTRRVVAEVVVEGPPPT